MSYNKLICWLLYLKWFLFRFKCKLIDINWILIKSDFPILLRFLQADYRPCLSPDSGPSYDKSCGCYGYLLSCRVLPVMRLKLLISVLSRRLAIVSALVSTPLRIRYRLASSVIAGFDEGASGSGKVSKIRRGPDESGHRDSASVFDVFRVQPILHTTLAAHSPL